MATAKSDDDSEERSHPVAQNRPGVYVHVVSPRRRKASHPSHEAQPSNDTQDAGDAPNVVADTVLFVPPEEVPSEFRERESSERVIAAPSASRELPEAQDESFVERSDLLAPNLPPPPRVPTFHAPLAVRQQPRKDEPSGASLLDAPPSLFPESHRPTRQTSWAMVAFVVTLTGIIAAAGVVAWRENAPPGEAARASQAPTPRAEHEDGPRAAGATEPALPEPALPEPAPRAPTETATGVAAGAGDGAEPPKAESAEPPRAEVAAKRASMDPAGEAAKQASPAVATPRPRHTSRMASKAALAPSAPAAREAAEEPRSDAHRASAESEPASESESEPAISAPTPPPAAEQPGAVEPAAEPEPALPDNPYGEP